MPMLGIVAEAGRTSWPASAADVQTFDMTVEDVGIGSGSADTLSEAERLLLGAPAPNEEAAHKAGASSAQEVLAAELARAQQALSASHRRALDIVAAFEPQEALAVPSPARPCGEVLPQLAEFAAASAPLSAFRKCHLILPEPVAPLRPQSADGAFGAPREGRPRTALHQAWITSHAMQRQESQLPPARSMPGSVLSSSSAESNVHTRTVGGDAVAGLSSAPCGFSRESCGKHGITATSEKERKRRSEHLRLSKSNTQTTLGRFEISEAWAAKKTPKVVCVRSQKPHRRTFLRLPRSLSTALTSEDSLGALRTKQAPIDPNSKYRIFWDICSLLVVIYDLVAIPLLFFDPEDSRYTVFLSWTVRIFWTVDMPLSFITGFVTPDGNVEMNLTIITMRYSKSWFVLDALMVGSDWAELLSSAVQGASYVQMGRASRAFRILRLLRLLRLLRMQETFSLIAERFTSEGLTIFTTSMKIIIGLAGLAHLIACSWYAVGKPTAAALACTDVPGEPGESCLTGWVAKHGYAHASLEARYSIALHWSLAQFAGGMDEITPHTLEERCFAICAFLLSFVLATCFVSVLTASMTQMCLVAYQKTQQVSILRRYLSQNGISKQLTMRVQRNAVKTREDHQRQMPEGHVELLHKISGALREELHFEMYSPIFTVQPFFQEFCHFCPHVMRKVCHRAASTQSLAAGDIVFHSAELSRQPKMYFVCDGTFQYHSLEGTVVTVSRGEWVAEASLWMTWMHRGEFRAVTEARLALLDARLFQEIVMRFDFLEYDPREYAQAFVEKMNRSEQEATAEITDLADLCCSRKTRSDGVTIAGLLPAVTPARWLTTRMGI